MANFIDHYQQSTVTKTNYINLIRQYAQIYILNGVLDIQEDYNPDTGNVIVGLERSHHYFHSGFIDLIMTGIVGIRDRPDDVLEVNTMIDTSLSWFRMEEIPYKGEFSAIMLYPLTEQPHTDSLLLRSTFLLRSQRCRSVGCRWISLRYQRSGSGTRRKRHCHQTRPRNFDWVSEDRMIPQSSPASLSNHSISSL